ncbi:hypothetical protein CPB83DRAFT_898829 [Crepidotus variabilis]|uniref:Uncharacterized protein n=1 Tax=Crepidotus variabilis TaxID=179855 RepID=A0A9P6E671_9AGAR|nr:hypothetical protein CPB83DRAFT_898829 [Crepidotus variabilis]
MANNPPISHSTVAGTGPPCPPSVPTEVNPPHPAFSRFTTVLPNNLKVSNAKEASNLWYFLEPALSEERAEVNDNANLPPPSKKQLKTMHVWLVAFAPVATGLPGRIPTVLHDRAIAFRHIEGSQIGQNPAEHSLNTLKDLAVLDRIGMITLNNVSNSSALMESRAEVLQEMGIDFDKDWNRAR